MIRSIDSARFRHKLHVKLDNTGLKINEENEHKMASS